MENEQNNSYLSSEKTGKLMLKYSLPCIISLLVGALYNIVDQIFIANADYLGSYGNAANTVVFPLTVIALAIAVMIGDGCCAFSSISLGKNRSDSAAKSVGNAVVLSVLSGVALTVIYLAFSDGIITVFGGTVNKETYNYSKEYFFWITLGLPFYVFGQAMNPVIRADGSPKFAMFSTLAGAVANIILDPVFIFGCRLGMMGAAVATVIGQIITAALAICYLCRMKIIKPSLREFSLSGGIIKETLSLGMCSFLSQISLVAAMAAINNMVRKYGALDPVFGQAEYAQIPMAVLGIVMKVFQIVISIVVGMAAGCIPIVGYNMGAGLIQIFGAANESAYYTDFAVKSFRIYLCMIVFACINKAAFIFLQAMGKAIPSTLLSITREIVFGVGLSVILPLFYGLDGVLYSMPAADILTAFFSLAVIIKTYKSLQNGL